MANLSNHSNGHTGNVTGIVNTGPNASSRGAPLPTGGLVVQALWPCICDGIGIGENRRPFRDVQRILTNLSRCIRTSTSSITGIPTLAQGPYSLLLTRCDGKSILQRILDRFLVLFHVCHQKSFVPSVDSIDVRAFVNLLQSTIDCGVNGRDALRALADIGVSIDSGWMNNNTPLLRVCLGGDMRVVQVLLEARAKVDAGNRAGQNPLWVSSARGYADIVDALICENDRLSQPPHPVSINEPFSMAVAGKHMSVVRVLLQHMSSRTSISAYAYERALETAVTGQDLDMLRLLLAAEGGAMAAGHVSDLLCYAAADGTPEAMHMLLEAKAQVDKTNVCGETALMVAAAAGRSANVDFLLGHGALVDGVASTGETALTRAIPDEFHFRSVSRTYPANKGDGQPADPDTVSFGGKDVPRAEAYRQIASVVKKLVDAKASVERISGRFDKRTPLLKAAAIGATPVVQVLLDAQADPRKTDSKGNNALQLAALCGDAGMMQLLLGAGVNVNSRNISGNTALVVAIEANDATDGHAATTTDTSTNNLCPGMGKPWVGAVTRHVAAAEVLIAAKADVESRNNDGQTPLIVAARRADAAMTKVLLKAKADISAVDSRGDTALAKAVSYCCFRYSGRRGCSIPDHISFDLNRYNTVPQMLIDAGADVNVCDSVGEPLIVAALEGKEPVWPMVYMLVAAKADLHVSDRHRCTPLQRAVCGNYRDNLSLPVFLAAKADLGRVDAQGNNAVLLAASHGAFDMIPFLAAAWVVREARNRYSDTILLDAIAAGREDVAKVLIDAGVNVNVCNDNGDSAVMGAVVTNQIDTLRALIDAKADVAASNKDNETPLTRAQKMDYMQAASILEAALVHRSVTPRFDPQPRIRRSTTVECAQATAYLLARMTEG